MSASSSLFGIVLAAGKGTRMKSDLPKGLHPVLGLPIVEHVARALKSAGVDRPIFVVGHGGERVSEALGDGYDFAWQTEQLGTGHAALMALPLLAGKSGTVLVLPGDTPLIDSKTLETLFKAHREGGGQVTVATVVVPDATGYGRVLRGPDGGLVGIVEHKDATPDQRQIREINSAIYCFDVETLCRVLPGLGNQNAQGEYYLPDAIAAILREGGRAVAVELDDHESLSGVNDRWQLALAEQAMRRRILRRHAEDGVTLLDPDQITVGPDVEIGVDTVLEIGTQLLGRTRVGRGCRIGPYSRLIDSTVGDGCTILCSQVVTSTLEDGARCGPYAHLRPGTVLGKGARVGNFVEIKNAQLGESVSAGHLTYIGDATVGERTNIGAGTITCNYDGFKKYRTHIGARVFVGSNSTLVAPTHIGDDSIVAAGSVVTSGDYPEDALVVGRSRTETKEAWAAQWRKKRSERT